MNNTPSDRSKASSAKEALLNKVRAEMGVLKQREEFKARIKERQAKRVNQSRTR
jgi:hypothetical protein